MPRMEDIDGCLWSSGTFLCTPSQGQRKDGNIKPAGGNGGTVALTANAKASPNLSTAILWALFPLNTAPAYTDPAAATRNYYGYLGAYSIQFAQGYGYGFTPLYESWNDSNAPQWMAAPMDPPTIVNGLVYVPTYDSGVYVFGFTP
jgi:hypothetical protein